MPMTHANNQEAVGDKLYFFRSPTANENKCLVFAHGGQLFGDGTFNLAAGLTVYFYQPHHGQALMTNPWVALMQPPALMETVVGPTPVMNYSLAKAVGTHWAAATTMTYQEIETKINTNAGVGQWTPHVVTIRRRFQGKGATVNLSEVVTGVTAHEPTINRFYIAACRGDSHHNILTLFDKI